MAMTGHRSQEPVKMIFKMKCDLFLWHYHQIMSEKTVFTSGEDKKVDV